MEIKERYIAPAMETVCFRPVETLAGNSFWNIYDPSAAPVRSEMKLVLKAMEPAKTIRKISDGAV